MRGKLDELYDELLNNGKVSSPKGDYVFEFDLMGNLLSASDDAIRVSGYPASELHNMSVWDVVDESCHDLMLENFAARKEGRPVAPYEVVLVTCSGKKMRIKVETEPVIDDGEVVRVTGRFFILD